MTRPDAPTDLELAAFAEDQLDPARRYEVAGWLAAHPSDAARTMADLHLTEGLRLALAGPPPPAPPAMVAAARRLERRLARRQALRRLWPAAAAVAMFALGWTGHALMAPPSLAPVIEAALEAEAALAARHAMVSQPETVQIDTVEIAARLGVTIPQLPQGWRIRDVQVVSGADRPGVAMALATPDMGDIMLYSVALDRDGPDLAPDTFRHDGRALAVFEKGQAAYVLVDGSAPMADLAGGANQLLRRFN